MSNSLNLIRTEREASDLYARDVPVPSQNNTLGIERPHRGALESVNGYCLPRCIIINSTDGFTSLGIRSSTASQSSGSRTNLDASGGNFSRSYISSPLSIRLK